MSFYLYAKFIINKQIISQNKFEVNNTLFYVLIFFTFFPFFSFNFTWNIQLRSRPSAISFWFVAKCWVFMCNLSHVELQRGFFSIFLFSNNSKKCWFCHSLCILQSAIEWIKEDGSLMVQIWAKPLFILHELWKQSTHNFLIILVFTFCKNFFVNGKTMLSFRPIIKNIIVTQAICLSFLK